MVSQGLFSRWWAWRVAGALIGLTVYWLLYPPHWPRTLWVLYDIAGVGVTCGLAGGILGHFVRRVRLEGDPIRVAALLIALVVAGGVQYAGWPFSGHLTCAWTAAILEASDHRNPRWYRLAAFAPGLVVILIRTFGPQMPRMGVHLYTLTAVAAATGLGGASLLALSRCRSHVCSNQPTGPS